MSEQRTLEEIQTTIKAARDSVWVINNELQKISENESMTDEVKKTIQRNVEHLKIIVSDPQVSASGEDISDLHSAISAGETELNK